MAEPISESPDPSGGDGEPEKKDTSPKPKEKNKAMKSMPSFALPSSLANLSVADAMKKLPLAAVKSHHDGEEFEKAVERCIPSEFILIASQDDVSQSQEDFFAMDHFKLPLPDGKRRWSKTEQPASVATCAWLQMMYENPKVAVAGNDEKPWSTLEILEELQGRIKQCAKLDANPTISSSRPLGPPRFDNGQYRPYYVAPPDYTGTRRALLIGCVTGEDEDKPLKGAINDVMNVRQFLVTHCGFEPNNVTMLQDNYRLSDKQQPTKQNIMDAWATMIQQSEPTDVNFIQFSGHGSRSDTNLYILPSDYKDNGNIMDDDILNDLIKAMPSGVYTTMLVDCCYSGTVGELPYILKSAASNQEIEKRANFYSGSESAAAGTATKPEKTTDKTSHESNQKIGEFFDMDTREEAIEKETKGGEEYQLWKQARKLKTQWMYFDQAKLAEFSKKAAEMLEKGAKVAYEEGSKAAVIAYDASKKGAKVAYVEGSKAGVIAYDASKKGAKVAYVEGSKAGVIAYDASKKGAKVAGKNAKIAAASVSKSASKAGVKAYDASKSGASVAGKNAKVAAASFSKSANKAGVKAFDASKSGAIVAGKNAKIAAASLSKSAKEAVAKRRSDGSKGIATSSAHSTTSTSSNSTKKVSEGAKEAAKSVSSATSKAALVASDSAAKAASAASDASKKAAAAFSKFKVSSFGKKKGSNKSKEKDKSKEEDKSNEKDKSKEEDKSNEEGNSKEEDNSNEEGKSKEEHKSNEEGKSKEEDMSNEEGKSEEDS